MMVRWTWLVPPAMRPPGAASIAGGGGTVEQRGRAGRVAPEHGAVEEELGDAELHERAGHGGLGALSPPQARPRRGHG